VDHKSYVEGILFQPFGAEHVDWPTDKRRIPVIDVILTQKRTMESTTLRQELTECFGNDVASDNKLLEECTFHFPSLLDS
jgi:hypothetical protein